MSIIKNIKNRTLLGIICIIISTLIIFLITPIFNNVFSGKQSVVRMSNNLKQGEKITENDISIIEVGKYNLPKNIATNPEDVVGKFVVADVFEGDYITPVKLSEQITTIDSQLLNLKQGEMAISITVDSLAVGVSSKLKQGDIIQIFTEQNGKMIVPDELKYVEVLLPTDSNGDNYSDNNDSDTELKTIILKVESVLQAQKIAECEQTKIHIALVTRNTAEKEKYLLEQKNIIHKAEMGIQYIEGDEND